MADLDGHRVAQDAVGQQADLFGHGGREEERLAVDGHGVENAPDVRQESHVAHAVGFVQNEHLDPGKIDVALAEMIEQSAGAGHHEFHTVFQRLDLRHLADAAVDAGASQVRVMSEELELSFDLVGQFSGRSHDQGPDLSQVAVEQVVHDGEQEGCGLAGPCLGDTQNVAPLEDRRYGLGLNGGRVDVSGIADAVLDPGIEIELIKTHR